MEVDDHELERVKRTITHKNAPDIDQEVHKNKDTFSLHLYDPVHRNTVINQFQFKNEKSAKVALNHVLGILGQELIDE